ncbi:MAG: GNAT family N-acetyltransferase [Acholeplasma sp.]|jgi:GNAT superfamily N-acetyltransferase|nr:MAG: GNAT family N-acetyltransferase [Acholeplasma sp.]
MQTKIDIHAYEKSQHTSILQFLNRHINPSDLEDYIKRLDKEIGIFLIMYLKNIVGVCFLSDNHNEHRGHTLDMDLKIDQEYHNDNVFNTLFLVIDQYIEDNQIDFISTSALCQFEVMHHYFIEHGYKEWFALKKMVHDGRGLPHHELTYRHYEDQDFAMYFQGLGDAFYPMRNAMDITPYHVCNQASDKKASEERESLLKEKDTMYLFFEKNNYIGAVTILGAEIDDFYVVDRYQGKGYGRKIIEFSVNFAKGQVKEPVFLTVVDWNEKAKNLYQSVGFQSVETKKYYRKIIQR